ncbi:MAG: Hint domain-containing protein [Pseudomonadota bacterium]
MFGWTMKNSAINHRAMELTGAYDGGLGQQTMGLMAGTRVASNLGWRSVDALAAGDMVLTFDNGMQELLEVRRQTFWLDAPHSDPSLWPVTVPAGALDNRTELTLLPDQGVLVESDAAADAFGDPFAVVPAHALDGVRGIYRAAPQQQVELITLIFAAEEVIYVEGGALVHCPRAVSALDAMLHGETGAYETLAPNEAAFVAECMVMEDQILATGGGAYGQATVVC